LSDNPVILIVDAHSRYKNLQVIGFVWNNNAYMPSFYHTQLTSYNLAQNFPEAFHRCTWWSMLIMD
jgi:hypothetical protein